MNILNSTFCLILLAGTALMADPPAAPQPITPNLLGEVLPILQAKYVDSKTFTLRDEDGLNDLIAQSDGKISLIAPESSEVNPAPIKTISLPGDIIYWRLASFTPEKSWQDLGTQLEQASLSATGIILDLRSNLAPDDFHGAAQVLAFFSSSDFTLSKFWDDGTSGAGVRTVDHPFHSPIIVLTNNQTSGAAEALAACLKADGALVIGSTTPGKAAVFAEQKLSSGQVLKYVSAEINLADGTPLWGHPVVPDIGLTLNQRTEKDALALIDTNHVLDVIQEDAERHRMSEASLVQGDDPEWDDYLATLEKRPENHSISQPQIRDTVLIAALDSLKAIQISQRHLQPSTLSGVETAPQASASIQ